MKQRRAGKRSHRKDEKPKQGERELIALMGRSLEGAIHFIEHMTGEKLTAEEIEELKSVLPKAWLRGDQVH